MTSPLRHAHDHRASGSRRLAVALALSATYMVAEISGGLAANSLALLADAGHMFSDVAALGLSLFAFWLARRPPTVQRTYGYYRTEILAATVNGAALVAVSWFIFLEAYHRLQDPPEVRGALMMAVAGGGLAVNLVMLRVLGGPRQESLNLRSAWLHVLADALGSVGALTAGGLVWAFGWTWADPATSVLVGLLIIYSAWQLLAESVSVLMENAPKGIDVDEVRRAMLEVPGVLDVHDLHIWTITSGMVALSAHVVADSGGHPTPLLAALRRLAHDRFGIDHVTVQIEPEGFEERPIAV